jgi:hypothetical protein
MRVITEDGMYSVLLLISIHKDLVNNVKKLRLLDESKLEYYQLLQHLLLLYNFREYMEKKILSNPKNSIEYNC